MRASLFVCIGLTMLCSLAAAATEPPREAFDAGQEAFAQEDYPRALEHFERAHRAGLDGPAIHYNIGVTRYRLNDYAGAAAAFHLIADRYPAMRALAQYNLGLVARRRGDQAEAEAFFALALAGSEDETLRELARRQLPRTEPVPDTFAGRWFSMIDARLGHDDNVLLRADDVPLPAGASASSAFTEVLALATGSLGASSFRFDGSLYAARYPDASSYDQSVAQAALVYQWDWRAWRAEAGPQFTYSTLDGTTMERRLGVGARLRRTLTGATRLSLRYLHDEISHGAERFSYLKGSRDLLELRADHQLGAGRLGAAYALERNDRAHAAVAPRRNRVSLHYRHTLSPRWLADMGVSWRRSRYRDMEEPRSEELTELSAALTRLLGSGWQVNAMLSHAGNDSSDPALEYDRQRFAVGFSKQF